MHSSIILAVQPVFKPVEHLDRNNENKTTTKEVKHNSFDEIFESQIKEVEHDRKRFVR